MMLSACAENDNVGDNDGGTDPTAGCETGTTLINGRCESLSGVVCGDGTVWFGTQCVPADSSGVPICGEGTVVRDGQCLPDGSVSETACGDGTILISNECVALNVGQLSCGLGTVEDRGKCVAVSTSIPGSGTCGAGTELVGGVCVPDIDGCAQGTILNEATNTCELSQTICGAGTSFDEGTEACVADSDITCGSGTSLDEESQTCLPDGDANTTCGTGTELVNNVCQPTIDGCGQGTVLDEDTDQCVLGAGGCGEGTSLDEGTGTCVPDDGITCGSGTVLDSGTSQCIPDGGSGTVCGTGTQLVSGVCVPDLDGCGAGTVEENGECVAAPAACGSGTTFDQGTGKCVGNATVVCGDGTTESGGECVVNADACGSGATFDSGTGTCVGGGGGVTCGPGTSLDPGTQQCIPGIILVGDCSAAPTAITPTTINDDMTLTAGCYTANDGLTLNSKLTLEPGVTIYMGDGKLINVRGGGQLSADCSAGDPCVFSGEIGTSAPGTWIGIYNGSNIQAGNVLRNVVIEHAGSTGNSFENFNFSLPFDVFDDVTFRKGRGLSVLGQLPSTFTNITVVDHEAGSIRTSADDIDHIDTTLSITAEPGFEAFVELTPGSANTVLNFIKLGVPWLWVSNASNGRSAATIVQPGTEIVFSQGSGWGFGFFTNGSLTVSGLANDMVIFRGLEDTRGYWRGIQLDTVDSANRIEYLELSNAGSNGSGRCLSINGSVSRFSDSTIRSCEGYALSVQTDATNIENFTNNMLTDSEAPMKFRSTSPLPVFADTTSMYGGNDRDEIDVIGTCSSTCDIGAFTMEDLGIPITVTDGQTFANGDVIQINNRNYIEGGEYIFEDNAILESNGANFGLGSSTGSLTLSGQFASPGSWLGVRIKGATGFANEIRNVTISDAGAREVTVSGFEGFYSMVIENNVRLNVIDGLTIENGNGAGIYVGSNVTINSCSNVDLSSFTSVNQVRGPGMIDFRTACGLPAL